MKAKTVLTICLVLQIFTSFVLASCQPDFQDRQVTVIVDALYVYDCPDISCNQVGVLLRGATPSMVGDNVSEFVPIKYFGAVRYVIADGVEK